MNGLPHASRAAWVSVLYAAIVVAILLASRAYDADLRKNHPADLRVNDVHAFPRAAGTSCRDIGDEKRLALFVEDMDTGLRAVGCGDAPPTVTFRLHHESTQKASSDTDQAVWGRILGDPLETLREPRVLRYDIRVPKEGDRPERSLAPAGATFSFYIFQWWSPVAVAVVLFVWALLVYLARHSALLRDAAPPDTPLANRTFSLAKTQLAWWFAIVFASFVFLWLVTGEMPSLSGQALSLLGISSATTMAAIGVSPVKRDVTGRSGVFFRDLLSDANGVAIQRFQMLVMTVALGLMFLVRVASRLTMPEFDASLLTLLGISAGTYVGLKIPESSSRSADAAKEPDTAADATLDANPKAAYTPTA